MLGYDRSFACPRLDSTGTPDLPLLLKFYFRAGTVLSLVPRRWNSGYELTDNERCPILFLLPCFGMEENLGCFENFVLSAVVNWSIPFLLDCGLIHSCCLQTVKKSQELSWGSGNIGSFLVQRLQRVEVEPDR